MDAYFLMTAVKELSICVLVHSAIHFSFVVLKKAVSIDAAFFPAFISVLHLVLSFGRMSKIYKDVSS